MHLTRTTSVRKLRIKNTIQFERAIRYFNIEYGRHSFDIPDSYFSV